MKPTAAASMFALLDDCASSSACPTSRLYTEFVRTHLCSDPGTLDVIWDGVEEDQRAGLHAIVLADYEWGAALMQAGHTRWVSVDLGGEVPALRVLMFKNLSKLSRAEADAWLAGAEGADSAGAAGAMNLHWNVDRQGFEAALAQIQERLRAGDTYQVNYTLPLDCDLFGSPVALFRRLRLSQPVRYGALITLEDGRHILSLSPELFIRHDSVAHSRRFIVQPMKGTAARSTDAQEDARTAQALASDRKSQAENVMIVDLLRNDLGRIAQAGSVKVSALFSVESYPSLFQLTSTIEADARPGLRFPDVMRAMFPCGSITGAPKHRTMEIIAALEGSPRGIYCGAIGWLDAPGKEERLGPFCLSVGIRTLMVERARPDAPALRRARLGVGAGIVLDSRAPSEFEEIALKARFLTELDPGFTLIETMLVLPESGVRELGLHLSRLARSARELGFHCDPGGLGEQIREQAGRLPPGTEGRMRLALSKDGRCEVTLAPLETLPLALSRVGAVAVGISQEPCLPDLLLSRHKTSWRPQYDPALREALDRGWFDLLFLDRAGNLVEGARSSVFLELDGRWFTPPVSSGALPGIMRQLLLADPAWSARERVLTREDLRRSTGIVVCNALRGPLKARLVTPISG